MNRYTVLGVVLVVIGIVCAYAGQWVGFATAGGIGLLCMAGRPARPGETNEHHNEQEQ